MCPLERFPSDTESNERSKERQGPTLGFRLIAVSVKKELTTERQGPTLGVRFRKVSVLGLISSVA